MIHGSTESLLATLPRNVPDDADNVVHSETAAYRNA
jgi:hypothetical protein